MSTASRDTPPTATGATRGKRRLRHWAAGVAVLVAVAITAGGCGGGSNTASGSTSGGSTSGGTSNADSAQQSGVAYAQCMRAHGVSDFPDNAVSSSGGGTKVNLPSGINGNPNYKSASQACQSKLPKGANGGNSSTNVSAELKLANCMRSHGVANFPEPNAQGRMIISGGSGVNPNSPTYQAAWKACRSNLPNNGAGLSG